MRRKGLSRGIYMGGVCLITDKRSTPLTCMEAATAALDAGIRWIQYREKNKSRRQICMTALALRELTRRYGAYFIVNDHADIARAIEADGVHLGQEDLPVAEARKVVGMGMIIGVSTHSRDEAARAQAEGADYVGFGPVFETATKEAGRPKGLKNLKEINSALSIPVVAIGGISVKNCCSVFDEGTSAVAAASAILKGDIRRNVEAFLRLVNKYA